LILTEIIITVPQEDISGTKDGTTVQHRMDNLTERKQYNCVCYELKLKTKQAGKFIKIRIFRRFGSLLQHRIALHCNHL
jgi:hypothetical protein